MSRHLLGLCYTKLMYLAVDIGGSKTLLAVFTTGGRLVAKHKIATDSSYGKFLKDFSTILESDLKDYKISDCCCAIPGRVERRQGIGLDFGNLKWHNVGIRDDFKDILGRARILIENDGNLGGLSEALLVHEKYKKVLYLTIGTGIGDALVINGKIDADLSDGEGGKMVLEHDGQLKTWEDFASGRALMHKYGRLASQIEDPKIWREFAKNLALGVDVLLAAMQPEVVIIGGGVGAHFTKFGAKLGRELKARENKMVRIPPIIQAKRPEEAVIYGCYDYIKQQG